jgi:hypothetical protein
MHLSRLLVGLWLLSGCSTLPPTTAVVLQPLAPVTVQETQPLTLNPVQWQVMTLEQLQKLVEQPPPKLLLFTLDTKNYNNLSLNLREIERYINEQKATLTMLKHINMDRAKLAPPMPAQ